MIWLIAEDETDILNLVATMCRVWGHTPLTFSSGQQVWDWIDQVAAGQFKGDLPQFALMDIRMPGKRGNEVARKLRQTPGLDHIPIALMTAYALSDDDRRAMFQHDGVDEIISKPLPTFEELHKLLHEIIAAKPPKRVD